MKIHAKSLIIAEAGVNHNGQLHLAKKLVDAAVFAGADIVKFQTFQAKELATAFAKQASYQQKSHVNADSQLSMLEKLQLTPQHHLELIDYCDKKNIEFLSSAFDIPSVQFLSSLKPKRWKIPSGEITNLPYLREIGAQCLPLILSTGMANLADIEAALTVLESSGTPRSNITVLHCTTEYPAPYQDVNLRALETISHAFGVSVGYSDHTIGITVPIAAFAMGATLIDKHLTLDRTFTGPDHFASLEPSEFADMVKGIRITEQVLGDGLRGLLPAR